MFSSAFDKMEVIKGSYLTSTEGAIKHSLSWLTAKNTDVIYPNPSFDSKLVEASNLKTGIGLYLIHGTADRVSAFSFIAEALINTLPSSISSMQLVNFDERARGKGIDDFAKQLFEKITLNGHQMVILAGHSRGGLVAAYFSTFLADKSNIEVLCNISIGTPFGGSQLALPPLTWISTSVAQMQPGCEFLKKLREQRNPNQVYYCVAGENDYIVNVESACLEKENSIVLKQHGHLSMMAAKEVIQYFRDCIGKESHKKFPDLNAPNSFSNEYEFLSSEVPALWDIYYEVVLHIEDLKTRIHMSDVTTKVKVFEKFLEMIKTLLSGKTIGNYPNTKTFGEFLDVFFEENLSKLIDTQLNYPQILFGREQSNSRTFVNRLRKTYGELTLQKNIKKPNDSPAIELHNNESRLHH